MYRVDDDPVVLMYGAVPAYRALRTGEEGADVKELERNLKALGYGGFTVDDSFTDATADAVKEWQDDQGLDQTGAARTPPSRSNAASTVPTPTMELRPAART
ncbi:peptidoglycan-binding domain-containing protein, partial [Streptomyces prunicolor]|uniref:peptidoglycan-binding domain-containing protein n=1 Tax=Streptomyces prunicolor TaxID=67348 RepID=UPI0033E5F63F